MTGTPQRYNTTMSWQQLIAAVNADMVALYAGAAGSGTVSSVGLSAGSADVVLGGTNPVTTTGTISVDLSAAVKSALANASTALQSISIATGTGLTGGPLAASGSTVALNSTSVANLALAASSLQPVTGLAGSYTYASLTLNASGQITAVANGTAPAAAANPSGTVGLTTVNGSAATFMRSDAAPPISQGISPTWTGNHTFTPASGIPIVLNSLAATEALDINAPAANAPYVGWKVNGTIVGYTGFAGAANQLCVGSAAGDFVIRVASGSLRISTNGGTSSAVVVSSTGTVSVAGALGVNGATPPAQVTGWGTPTGAAVVANFNGASATLVNCSNAIAELITILKAAGIIAA